MISIDLDIISFYTHQFISLSQKKKYIILHTILCKLMSKNSTHFLISIIQKEKEREKERKREREEKKKIDKKMLIA